MPTITYADLIKPLDATKVFQTAIDVFNAAQFPTDAWGETDEPRAILQQEADILADLSQMIVEIGKMGVLAEASGEGLTLHASDTFKELRKPAAQTRGNVSITNSTNSTIVAISGTYLVTSVDDGTLIFKNTANISVPALTTVTAEIGAEQPGVVYNVGGNKLAVATPVPGLSLTAVSDQGWITQAGADEENDDSLRARCEQKWATLSASGGDDAYLKWALDSSTGVNRAVVLEDATAVPPDPAVTVVIAGPVGPPTTGAATTANTYIQARRPLGILVLVKGSTARPVELRGRYTVKAAFAAQAAAHIASQLATWFSGLPITIGGQQIDGLQIGETVKVSRMTEIFMDAPGVVDVVFKDSFGAALETGATFVFVGDDEVPTLSNLMDSPLQV